MVDGEESAAFHGRVGPLGAQTWGVAAHLAAVAAGRLPPRADNIDSDYNGALQLHGRAGYPRRNQWSGCKVLAGGGYFDLGPELQKVKAHQNLELHPPVVTNSV
eukprot:2637113-Pyramimonas_sp.AAC.1